MRLSLDSLEPAELQALVDQLAPRIMEKVLSGDPWFDARQAAEYLGRPVSRIHNLTSSGQLEPDGRDGRLPMYRRSTLDRYLEASGGA